MKNEYETFIDDFTNPIPEAGDLSRYAKPVSIDEGNKKIHLNITMLHEHLFPTTEQQNQTQIENFDFKIFDFWLSYNLKFFRNNSFYFM